MVRIILGAALVLAVAACGDANYAGSATSNNNGNNGSNNGNNGSNNGNNGSNNGNNGNNGSNNGNNGSNNGNNGSNNGNNGGLPEPERHRPRAQVCDDERPLWGDPGESWEGDPCQAHSDCDEGPNGRCLQGRGGNYCDYDQCFGSDDCDGGCLCGQGDGSNHCLTNGNCADNEECGPGGWCSPTFGSCGSHSGFIAYYCRTAKDECLNDSDCVDPNRFEGYCAYNEAVGHWACSWDGCDG